MELQTLLAHGRGAGWLGALARGSAARELVLQHVIDDPRFDRQIEARAEYYAAILLALGGSVEPIVDALARRDPDEPGLPRAVLIQMAWRRHLGALAAAVDRVRRGDGRLLHEFEDLAGSQRAAELAALARRPFVPTPVTRGAPPSYELPTTIAALVDLTLAPNDDPRKVAAGRRLGELGDAALLDQAEAFLRGQVGLAFAQRRIGARQRRAWMVYLEALPAEHTLERARAWFHEPWPLGSAAEAILSRHAEPDDRPMLEAAGSAALAQGHVYRLCSVIEALTLLAAPESIPLLVEIYCTTNYSYARERVVEGLLDHREDERVQALLVESLWDCESGTRVCACDGVNRADALARLRELADDPHEPDDVREAAHEALELG